MKRSSRSSGSSRGRKKPKSSGSSQSRRRRGSSKPLKKKEFLHRTDSKFQCEIKFRNNIPAVPLEAKLLRYPLDKLSQARYTPSSLEHSYKHVILTEPNLGIGIDLIDPETYAIPPQEDFDLAPEDETLLQASHKKDTSKTSRTVSWLHKTQYISNEGHKTVLQTPGLHRALNESVEEEELSVREIKSIIEKTFRAAKKTPTHAKNPRLKVVEEVPLLPDSEFWGNFYTLTVMDTNPVARELGEDEGREDVDRLMRGAVIKGFVDEEKDQTLVGCLVPNSSEGFADALATRDVDIDVAYHFSKGYSFLVNPNFAKTRHFVLSWRNDGVYYSPIQAKTSLSAIKSENKVIRQFRKRQIVASFRDRNDDEIMEAKIREEELRPGYDDDESMGGGLMDGDIGEEEKGADDTDIFGEYDESSE